jgi:DNA-binding LacI/PurR family transcriptional regulator
VAKSNKHSGNSPSSTSASPAAPSGGAVAEKSVRIKQIAEKLGVSQGTVSIVLNGRGDEMRISKATQAKVLEAAKDMDYRPNIYARRLRQAGNEAQAPVIAVFWTTDFLSSPLGRFFTGIQRGLLEDRREVEVILQPYERGSLRDKERFIDRQRYSGAIMAGISESDEAFLLEKELNIPIIMFNRAIERYGTVYVDDYEAGRKTAWLFSRRGHERACLVHPAESSKAATLRKAGFIDGCAQHGVSLPEGCIRPAGPSFEEAEEAVRTAVGAKPSPTALFLSIDNLAPGAYSALRSLGIGIPRDMEVLAYGDNELAKHMTPSLTSIHVPIEEMGRDCLRLLMSMLESKDFRPNSLLHPLNFVFRESCGDSTDR